jgi:hypothetical protein
LRATRRSPRARPSLLPAKSTQARRPWRCRRVPNRRARRGADHTGDAAARIAAGLFGAGLGWIYVAAGRSLVAPICARLAFVLGPVVLEALRIVG